MTVKDNTKDALILAAALGIPVLAASQNSWGALVDIIVIVPFVWLGLRRSMAWSLFAVALSAIAVWLASGSIELAVSKGLLVLGVSSIFTLGIARDWKPGKVIFWASLVAGIYGFYSLMQMATGPLLQRHPIALIENSLLQMDSVKALMDQYRQAGLLELFKTQGVSEPQVQQYLEQGLRFIAQLFPSLLIIGSIVNVLLSFLLSWLVLPRTKRNQIPLGPFRKWALPWYAVWGAILGIASYLVGENWHFPGMMIAGLNISVVYLLVCMVLGISVAAYFFASPKIPLVIKIIFIAVTFFNLPVTSIILALFGLFDLVLNFRKLPSMFEAGGKKS